MPDPRNCAAGGIVKVCARCVPGELNDPDRMNRMGLSLQHLLRYADEGEDMLNRIVTGDES
jgi:hypothetical protein